MAMELWKCGSSIQRDPPPQYFPATNAGSNYTIQLKITNNTIGCSDSISKTVHVLNGCRVAVPSAFTPNNDGKNDFLYPINGWKVTGLEFSIFNRWGQLVFSTSNPTEKWNGTVKGMAQPAGLFVWHLKYTDPVTGQKVFTKGTTMLIR